MTISRPDDVRQNNRQRILAVIRKDALLSRTDISAKTGLSAATVSAITSDLLEEGALIRGEPRQADSSDGAAHGRGRPQVALGLNPEAALVCAVYFQLNHLSASLFDYSGTMVSEYTLEITTKNITVEEIRSALETCIEGALGRTVMDTGILRHIELGFQGVTDVVGEQVLWTPICGQTELPIADWLSTHFGVSTHVANDCDMIALALNWRDPKKYGANFAAVLLAHGVGMGLFLRGGIINGTHSSGVEFGHMTYLPGGALCRCGNLGCIEAYAGDYAICRRANGQAETVAPSGVMDLPDLASVLEAAKRGEENALTAIENAGVAIGTGLASLFAIVDAFPIVLIGRGTSLFKYMEPTLRAALETAPGENHNRTLEITCYPDERPLVREGCAIRGLLAFDTEIAKQRHTSEAAE